MDKNCNNEKRDIRDINEKKDINRIIIYDTTLRDGMQGQEVNYSLDDKIKIAIRLDELGIDYIEGGFPLSNKKEEQFFKEVKKIKLKNAKIAAFGSTRRPNGKASDDPHILALVESEAPVVTIVGKAWLKHVEYVIKTTEDENLAMIYDSIKFLKSKNKEVVFDAEHFFDGFKEHSDYCIKVLQTANDAGADTLCLCDTNGGMITGELIEIIKKLSSFKNLGIHMHNDTGMAVASSIMSVEYGVKHIQGTINGWGERCGNANLCTIIPNLALKMNKIVLPGGDLKELTLISKYVSEIANIIPDKRQPYVGTAAFSHKAGQHADVIVKNAKLIEHIDASLVGNKRRILLSELSGRSTIANKLNKYGDFSKDSPVVKELTEKLKSLENKGYEYEAAEASFDLVMRKILNMYQPLFELKNYHIESFKSGDEESKTVTRIFIRLKDREVMGAGTGIGPVETLDKALQDALLVSYPFLNKLKLIDYKVRVLNPTSATSAKVRVFTTNTDGENTWDTVGVSENVIEASWYSLVDSMEYYYNNYVLKGNE